MNYLKKNGGTHKHYANLSRLMNCIYPILLPILLVIFLAFAGFLVNDGEFKDFGINFLAELIGIFVMVYVVEFFYSGMHKNKMLPIRIVIFRDLMKIFDRYFLLWKAAYQHVGIGSVEHIEAVYNQKLYIEMMRKLDLDDKPNEHDTYNWAQLITMTSKEIEKDLNGFIRMHYSRMDPKLLSSLFQFLESDFLGSSLELSKLKKLRGKTSTSFHSVSLKPGNNTFELILDIHYWIIQEKTRLNCSSSRPGLSTTFRSEMETGLEIA